MTVFLTSLGLRILQHKVLSTAASHAAPLSMYHEALWPSAAVVQGQAKPLMRPGQICPAIHGESGLEFLDGSSMQARPSLV